MSEITEKFCEECGKNSPIGVKFCKFCGVEFPKIDHPEYIQTNFPQERLPQQPQGVPPPYQQMPQQPPQFQPPQSPKMPPPGFGRPAVPNQMGPGFHPRKPPRMWKGGGLPKAIKEMYTDPTGSTASLLEDPQAPSAFILIFLAALTSSLVAYFTAIKTTFIEIIDDDEGTLEPYITSNGIKDLAVNGAVVSFIVVFLSWGILSWILGKILKGGLPPDQYLLNAPTKSMRQLSAFLYFPTIIRNLVNIVLLQFENKRDAKISVTEFAGISTPNIEYLSDFSSNYNFIIIAISIVAALITATIFYKATRNGLNHNGSAPLLIAILIALVPLTQFA